MAKKTDDQDLEYFNVNDLSDDQGDDGDFEPIGPEDSYDDSDGYFGSEDPVPAPAPRHRKSSGKRKKQEEDDTFDLRRERYSAQQQRQTPPPHRGKRHKKSRLYIVNLIVLIAIVALVVIIVVRFQVWNKGQEQNLDPSSESAYSVEVNDNMVLLTDEDLAGHEDDGVNTIVCLGDAPFSDDTSEEGLAGQIAALSQTAGESVNVINASFPNSQVACVNASYTTDTQEDMDDIFNLFYVSYAISIGDYSSLATVASVHTDDPQYAAAVEALQNTDWSTVDTLVVMYDASDYVNGSPIQNPDNDEDLTTYVTCLADSFQMIQDAYPYIRIIFMSPTYMLYEDENGDLQDGRTTDLGNGTLIQYWQWAFDTCGSASVSFIDNYYGSVNDSNYEEYLSDNIHLNALGRKKIADHFVYKVIEGNYGEYDANAFMVATDETSTATTESTTETSTAATSTTTE